MHLTETLCSERRKRARPRSPIFILLLITAALGVGNTFGQGCTSPICSPNPTPCAHCIGNWTDNYGDYWTVSSPGRPGAPGTQSVTGKVVIPPQEPWCPNYTFTVSGTLTQTTGTGSAAGTATFEWNASNPSPTTPCGRYDPVPFSFGGNIANDGCDTASGTWVNSTGIGGGSFDMTKPSDVASTESSTAVAWWSLYPTILIFQGNISSADSLAGKQVFESPNGTPSDSCNRPGDRALGYQSYHLTGGGWYVGYYYFNSSYYYDYVGVSPGYIAYYRSKGRTPCGMSAPQAMSIYTRAGLGSVKYYSDTLQISLPDNVNVGVERGGTWGWRTW